MKTSWQPLRALFQAKIEGRVALFVFTLLISGTFLPASRTSAQTVAIEPQTESAAGRQKAARGKSTVRGRVSGTVTVEGGNPFPPSVIIYPEIDEEERRIETPPSLALVQPDGTFIVDGLPAGGVWIRALIRADYKYYIRSVTANGVDLMQEPLTINEGGEVKTCAS